MRKTALVCSAVLASLLFVEIGVRASGLTDFPTYHVQPGIEYWPRENQSGAFLNTNDWSFNGKGMPISRTWSPNIHPNLLLIGNSIVMGGNPYRQEEKLAPQLQKLMGEDRVVWPIAAGGWTEINEMAFLDRHPEIVEASDYFAWEYMSGGLSTANRWPGEYVFPSHKPIYASWYVARRYVFPRIFTFRVESELPPRGLPDQSAMGKFADSLATMTHTINGAVPGIIWLFPTAAELDMVKQGREWLPERRQIREIADRRNVRIVDIAANPAWRTALYRSDRVHPTAEGFRVLASILHTELIRR